MKRNLFDHNVRGSFALWLDHTLLHKGECYYNTSGIFKPANNIRFQDYDVFKAPYSQLVYDSSITGAQIPTGVYLNNSWTGFGPKLILDYNNGRILAHKSLAASSISSAYSYKEISVYTTSLSEGPLLFENKFVANTKTYSQNITGDLYYSYPSIFVKYNPGVNLPFCLGGEDVTSTRVRLVFIADSAYMFDGVAGILRDSVRKHIPYVLAENMPIGPLGGLKSGLSSFDYTDYYLPNDDSLLYISKVSISPLSEELNLKIAQNVTAGFIDLDLQATRFPRT